jgi:hypothetical protein
MTYGLDTHPLQFSTACSASFFKTPYATIAEPLETPVFQNILNPFWLLISHETKDNIDANTRTQSTARH